MERLCAFCIRCLLERHEKVISRSVDADPALLQALEKDNIMTKNEIREINQKKVSESSKVLKMLSYVKKKMGNDRESIFTDFLAHIRRNGRHQHVINLLNGNVNINDDGRRPDLPLSNDALKSLDQLSAVLNDVLVVSDEFLAMLVDRDCINQQQRNVVEGSATTRRLKTLVDVVRRRSVLSFRKFVDALANLNREDVDVILLENNVITFVEFGVVDLPTKEYSIQSRITDIMEQLQHGRINHPDINKLAVNLRQMMVNHVIAVRPAAVRPFVRLVVFCADNVDRRWINEYTRLNGGVQLKQDLETWIARWLHANGGIKVTINCASVSEEQIGALTDGSTSALDDAHNPVKPSESNDRLLLFIARRGLRLERYKQDPKYFPYIHCLEKLNTSCSLNKRGLIALCCSLMSAIQLNQLHNLLEIFNDVENPDDDDDDVEPASTADDSDIEDQRFDRNVRSLKNLKVLCANICKCGNISAENPIVELIVEGKDVALLIIIDDRLDPNNSIRPDLRAYFGGLNTIDTLDTCASDMVPLDETQRAAMIISPDENVLSKPFFYPLQIFAAEQLVKRIEFILRHYKKRELSDFKMFDFRIYTARSKLLETQTVNRLRDKGAGCFANNVYGDENFVKEQAENRVRMYVVTKNTDSELNALKEDAINNTDKLILIVADEAHWGTSSQCITGESANSRVVNMWTDEYPNVVVLQVTATPWNLLTTKSRIPSLSIAELKSSGELLAVKTRGRRGVSDLMDKDVTSLVGPVKELHIMKWNETLVSCLQNGGLLVVVRVPQKPDRTPIWLSISKQPTDDYGIHRWEGCTDNKTASRILLRTDGENRLKVTNRDGSMTLVIYNTGPTNAIVGFVTEQTLKQLEETANRAQRIKVHKYFVLQTEFNEGIMEIQTSTEEGIYLKFELKDGAGNDEVVGMVVCSSTKPGDSTVQQIDLVYHSLEYSFLIEHQFQISHPHITEQYLSLNFYYNTMRNEDIEHRLIREDISFQNMAKVLTVAGQTDNPDDVLAAEYAYYILIINLLRSTTAREIVSVIEQLSATAIGDDTFEYLRKKEASMLRMKQALDSNNKNTLIIPAIQTKAFYAVVNYMTANTWKKCERTITRLKSKQRLQNDDKEEFLENFVSYYAHSNVEHLIYILIYTKNQLGPDKCSELVQFMRNPGFKCSFESLLESETFNIVSDLIVTNFSRESGGLRGHMKIIRVSDKACGNRLYTTLSLAREIGSNSTEYFFEVLRYFDNLQVVQYENSKPLRRIWQALQRHKCDAYVDIKAHVKCPCRKYEPIGDEVACSKCRHAHHNVSQFSDLDRLPCIVILVEKGRMGDTFPPSLNVMDLRVRSQNNVPPMTSLMQELGRLCRYQSKSPDGNYSELPYALVGPKIVECLRKALPSGAPMYCAFEKNSIDSHCKRRNRKQERPGNSGDDVGDTAISAVPEQKVTLMPSSRHCDHDNEKKHTNRLLFQAEPQIGKTGVYLKTIALLRQRIEPDGEDVAANSSELEVSSNDCEYTSDENDDDDVGNGEASSQRLVCSFPYWNDMRTGELKTELHDSKYSAVFGGYVHGKEPEYKLSNASASVPRKKRTLKIGVDVHGSQYSTVSHVTCPECAPSTIPDDKSLEFDLNNNGEPFCHVTVPFLARFLPLIKCLRGHTQVLRQNATDIGGAGNSQREQNNSEVGSDDSMTLPETDDSQPRLRTWIFNPSYGRADEACVNYGHTMVNGDTKCNYVQILVVRPEEFDKYSLRWKTTHAIMKLPPDFDGADVVTGGVGYARRIIQVFAEIIGVDRIFVIDDNLSKLYLATESQQVAANIPLFNVLGALEMQFECAVLKFGNFPASSGPLQCKCIHSVHRIHQYTGPRMGYAVLGIRKSRKNRARVACAFTNTHVYSLVLLNIKSLKEKNIRYKPWQVHEDCNLNNDCDKHGLIVCKYNRFIMTKRWLTPWFPQIYVWNHGSILHYDNGALTPWAESSGDTVLKWIRHVAAPRRLEVVVLNDSPKIDVLQLADVKSCFLTKLKRTYYGKTHAVAFFDKSTASSDYDMEHFVDTGIVKRRNGSLIKSVHSYFTTTPGIGGFETHLIIMHASLCAACQLLSIEHFLMKLIKPIFEFPLPSEDIFQVVTSHNVNEFRVPFVILLVRGYDRLDCKPHGQFAPSKKFGMIAFGFSK